jgi:hypothetical protein
MFLGFLLSLIHLSSANFAFTSTPGYLGGGETLLTCEFAEYSGPCKVDTGLNFTTIPLLENTSSLKSIKKITHTSASGSAIDCDLIDVSELFFSGQSVAKNLRWVRCTLEAWAKPILGLDVLAQKYLYLNYSRQSLSFERPTDLIADKNFARGPNDHIILNVGFKGGALSKAMFDTGASITAVSQKFYEANPHLFTVVGELATKDTHGKMIGNQLAILNWIDVGSRRFAAEYVTIMDFGSLQDFLGDDVDFVLGFSVISRANWFFDFENDLWTVE